jgi:hypothetical protein
MALAFSPIEVLGSKTSIYIVLEKLAFRFFIICLFQLKLNLDIRQKTNSC